MKPLALILVGCAVYANALNNPFVFDDETTIVTNESIHTICTPFAPPRDTPVAGRPVVNASFALNYAVHGLDETGYHVVNIALHISSALLLLGLLRRTLPDKPDSILFLVALLWLAHPLHSECINYVTQRTELMMGMFYLATLYTAARSWRVASVLCCAAGMLCKESMVTAPLMVALWMWVFRREKFRENLGYLTALASTWLIIGAVLLARPRTMSVGFNHDSGSWEYLLNQSQMIAHYLKLVVWPHPLLLDYGKPAVVTLSQVWPYGLFLVALLALTAVLMWRRPKLGFAGAWFFIILSPTSSFVPIVVEVAAERRMYLPLIGALAFLAMLPRRAIGVLLVVAVVLGAVTVKRNADYRNPIGLWEQVLDHRPDSPRAHSNLAHLYEEAGDGRRAVQHRRDAARLSPDSAALHYNLGTALLRWQRPADAIEPLRTACRLQPDFAKAYGNLGRALGEAGRPHEALRVLEYAAQLDPQDPKIRINLETVRQFLRNDE